MTKLILAAAAFAVLSLSGCNTIKGVGKDVEKVGTKTQEVAADTSENLDKKNTKK